MNDKEKMEWIVALSSEVIRSNKRRSASGHITQNSVLQSSTSTNMTKTEEK